MIPERQPITWAEPHDKPPFFYSLTEKLEGVEGGERFSVANEVCGHRLKDPVFKDSWREFIAANPEHPLSKVMSKLLQNAV